MHNRTQVTALVTELYESFLPSTNRKNLDRTVQQVVTSLEFSQFQDTSFEHVEDRCSKLHEKFFIAAQEDKAKRLDLLFRELVNVGLDKDYPLQSILTLLLDASQSPVNVLGALTVPNDAFDAACVPTVQEVLNFDSDDETISGQDDWQKEFDEEESDGHSSVGDWGELDSIESESSWSVVEEHNLLQIESGNLQDSESVSSSAKKQTEIDDQRRPATNHLFEVNDPAEATTAEYLNVRNPLCVTQLPGAASVGGNINFKFKQIHEISLVRNVILELQGMCTSDILDVSDCPSHISPSCLEIFFDPYRSFRDSLHLLRKFGSQVWRNTDNNTSLSLQALQYAILQFVSETEQMLSNLEAEISSGKSHITTLLGLEWFLRPIIDTHKRVAALTQLYDTESSFGTMRLLVGNLLTHLYQESRDEELLREHDALQTCNDTKIVLQNGLEYFSETSTVFTKLFQATCQPYLNMIHSWTQFGRLSDPFNEFFICDQTSQVESNNDNNCDQVNVYVVDHNVVPVFLYDSSESILQCGKLHHLLLQSGITSSTFERLETGSVQQLQSLPSSWKETTAQVEIPENDFMKRPERDSTDDNVSDYRGEHNTNIPGVHPMYLSYVPLKVNDPQSIFSAEQEAMQAYSSIANRNPTFSFTNTDDLMNVGFVLNMVSKQELGLNTRILELLLGRYHFVQQLEMIQNIMFALHQEVVDQFLAPIFDALNTGDNTLLSVVGEQYAHHLLPSDDPTQQVINSNEEESSVVLALDGQLSDTLQSAVSSMNNGSMEHLAFQVDAKFQPQTRDSGEIGATDGLQVKVQVQSPLDIVVDAACMKQYHQVFRFLIKVKRTQSTLIKLHHQLRHGFSSKEMYNMNVPQQNSTTGQVPLEDPPPSIELAIHQMCIFLKLQLHFVSNLHEYILHRIVHVLWKEFIHKVASVQTLDELNTLHKTYLDTVSQSCMLPTAISGQFGLKTSPVMEAILELLSCSLRFCTRAQNFLMRVKLEGGAILPRSHAQWNTIQDVHEQFERHSRFFMLSLKRRVASGDVNHLAGFLLRLDFSKSDV